MHITGHRNGPPAKVGVAVTDLTTGLYASNSILAAVLARQKTGLGQWIDVALSDCQTATLANIASSVLVSGERDDGRWGTAHRKCELSISAQNTPANCKITASIVPYEGFPTSDGQILLGGGNDRLYSILCQRIGKPEWVTDTRFLTNNLRVKNRDILVPLIGEVTKTKSTREWLEIFEGSGMPYAPINDVKDALENPHTQARNMVIEVDHPKCGTYKAVNTPVKFSRSNPGLRKAPPTLGEDTHAVLKEVLGLDGEDIEELREDGVIC